MIDKLLRRTFTRKELYSISFDKIKIKIIEDDSVILEIYENVTGLILMDDYMEFDIITQKGSKKHVVTEGKLSSVIWDAEIETPEFKKLRDSELE